MVDRPKTLMVIFKIMDEEAIRILPFVNAVSNLVFESLLLFDKVDDLLFNFFTEFKNLLHFESCLTNFFLGCSFSKIVDMSIGAFLDFHDLIDGPRSMRCARKFQITDSLIVSLL